MVNPETSGGESAITTVSEPSVSDPSVSPIARPDQVQVDDSDSAADYANFCRISGTPEELLIDFGLNPQPIGTPTDPIVVRQRVVTSWHTAKRLLSVLQMTVARHEAVFGVLETDVQKRVRNRQS